MTKPMTQADSAAALAEIEAILKEGWQPVVEPEAFHKARLMEQAVKEWSYWATIASDTI